MERTEHCGYTDLQGMSRIQQDLHNSHSSRGNDSGYSSDQIDMLRTAMARARQIHVGIVGAGFAGLRCADVLLQQGCKVTIFEARNRVGGRVAQSEHLGYPVDLGPNWIHGSDNNPIMEIARSTNTTLHAWDEAQAMYDTDGSTLDPEECREYQSLLWDDGVLKAAFEYSNKFKDSIPLERSLYDFFEEKAQDMFTDDEPQVAARKRKTFLRCTEMWGCYVGSPVTRQSLKFFWLEECIEGENPFVAGTYGKILNAVAQPAEKNAIIHLNQPVTRIISESPKTASPDDGQDSQVTLLTADGTSYPFDEVVVTSPLGWLKRNHQHTFEPALPQRLSQAIDNLSYGHLDKVYITFPSAFWEPSSPSDSSHHPGFTHWLQPTYAPSTNPHHWDQECMNLAALGPPCAQPTLLFYIYGAQSQHIASLVRAHPSPSPALDTALLAHFEPYFSKLPHYSPSNPACKPSAVLATAWANDEYAGYGSYTNFQVGLEHGDVDIEVLRKGAPERGIWFAGEHTAPFVALGTTTGAYWSGERVARRVGEAYGLEGRKEGV